MNDNFKIFEGGNINSFTIDVPKPPISTIIIGKGRSWQIGVDKKFNWFQKKMIKWCFGFEIKENKRDE